MCCNAPKYSMLGTSRLPTLSRSFETLAFFFSVEVFHVEVPGGSCWAPKHGQISER
jgi:hypothetical protein